MKNVTWIVIKQKMIYIYICRYSYCLNETFGGKSLYLWKAIKFDNVALSAYNTILVFYHILCWVMQKLCIWESKKRHRKGPLLTLPVPCISESCIEVKIKFFFSLFSHFFHSLFSHFFVVPQKFLWRPLRPS